MTFNTTRLSSCAWVELRQSAGTEQTISNGDVILFNTSTKRSTGGDSVSYDNSTGVLSLSSARRYWVQASIAIKRASGDDYEVEWQLSDGTALTPSDGAFSAYVKHVAGTTSYPFKGASFVASLMVDNPSNDYRLTVTDCPANSTVLEHTHLFIMELK